MQNYLMSPACACQESRPQKSDDVDDSDHASL